MSNFTPVFLTISIDGVKGFAIYPYADLVQSSLYKLKGCFDIEMAKVFIDRYKTYLNLKYDGYIIVPAPSYKDADEKRGFNHVQEIFKSMKNIQYHCVNKIKNVKQSDLNFEQRKHIIEALMFDETFDIRNKKILIVDDVFTTGSTMSAMIKLIKEHHPKKIQFLTMSIVLSSSRNHIKK